jgi:hypothetical protein
VLSVPSQSQPPPRTSAFSERIQDMSWKVDRSREPPPNPGSQQRPRSWADVASQEVLDIREQARQDRDRVRRPAPVFGGQMNARPPGSAHVEPHVLQAPVEAKHSRAVVAPPADPNGCHP